MGESSRTFVSSLCGCHSAMTLLDLQRTRRNVDGSHLALKAQIFYGDFNKKMYEKKHRVQSLNGKSRKFVEAVMTDPSVETKLTSLNADKSKGSSSSFTTGSRSLVLLYCNQKLLNFCNAMCMFNLWYVFHITHCLKLH